jgi:DNA adenine methylase
MPSIIRYPGSKAKLVQSIRGAMPDWMVSELWEPPTGAMYVEPFFGSGAVGLELLEHVGDSMSVWINDADYGMYAMWKSIKEHTAKLVRFVRDFEPSTKSFYELKSSDGTASGDFAFDGFCKIALHRMSVSGFGRMAGGPIGGRDQSGDYTVGCRWNPASVEQAIYNARATLQKFNSVRITNLHVREVLAEATPASLIYLDPPYYVKGGQLYAHNMSHDEHVELAALLRHTPADWRLSYDDCPEVRDLYSWAQFRELEIRYTNAVTDKKRPKNRELLISPQESDNGR